MIRITAVILALMVLLNAGCAINRESLRHAPQPTDIFDQAAELIEKNYIDRSGKPVKLDKSLRPDISSLVVQTDESTVLWTREDFEIMQNASAAAIGIALKVEDGLPVIMKPLPDSPASKVGLRRGDKILEVDSTSAKDLSITKVMRLLQGSSGTEVLVKVADKSGNERVLKVTRKVITIPKTAAGQLIESNIGYLRIERFWPETSREVREIIKRFEKQDAIGVIIDLRNNEGGLMTSVTGVAELFVKRKATIVNLDGRYDGQKQILKAGKWFPYNDVPLVILIDGKTASGAEILAAALQDNNRALLVGEKTKGLCDIQTVYPLKDGSAIRLRTTLANTPSDIPIDGHGIKPDKVVVMPEDVRTGLYEQMDSFPDLKQIEVQADAQLKAGVDILTRTERNE